MNEGWICSYRAIWDHPIFKGNAERVGVWDWMLKTAAWKPTRFNAGAEVITLDRGQLCVSQAQVTSATGMTRQSFRTFLKLLENEGAVQIRPATKLTKGRTLITVCKYDKYQDQQPKPNQTATKQQPTKEQGNNIPVGEADKSAPDLASQIFTEGRKILCAAGQSDAAARSLLGKWRREAGDPVLVDAISRAQRENALDPVGFITGCLRFSKKKSTVPQSGDHRTNAAGQRLEFEPGMGWVEVFS